MENIGNSYLHKKFKKQLSVDTTKLQQQQQNEKEIKKTIVESCEEKTTTTTTTTITSAIREDYNNGGSGVNSGGGGGNQQINQNYMRKDNNDSVPNQSTNLKNYFVLNSNVSSNINNKSSISLVENCNLANLQSTNASISYVVSSSNNNNNIIQNQQQQQQQQQQQRPVNFQIKQEPVASTTSSSSILNSSNKHNYVTSKPEDISSHNINESDETKSIVLEQQHNRKIESIEPPQQQQQQTTEKVNNTSGSGGKYVCQYCNLVCSKPSVLQKHIRAHTNERPFPCDSCGFSFKTRSNLYKHCRSRTHANRVMGNKAQEINNDEQQQQQQQPPLQQQQTVERKSPVNNDDGNKISNDLKTKPYKPRFHTGAAKQYYSRTTKENIEDDENLKHSNSDLLSHHINEIINKNASIVNSNDPYLLKKRSDLLLNNNNDYRTFRMDTLYNNNNNNQVDEPLNLTKNRKRCMSEIVEPVAQKSLIKELLLKNLNSDMQCPHCKMIFQTVTELELHKMRSCKGFVKPGAKYSRSSSVNVASILTQNKNAFDNIPHLQNAGFPLKSPGPFLGKTRLVESDKSKSFSFDDGLPSFSIPLTNERFLLSPLTIQNDNIKDKKPLPVKLFGGEVKISGDLKNYKIEQTTNDEKIINDPSTGGFMEYQNKLSENRVVKSCLQSGGTVLTNKSNHYHHPHLNQSKQDMVNNQDVIRVYEHSPLSPNIDLTTNNKTTNKFNFDRIEERQSNQINDYSSQRIITTIETTISSPSYTYTNIMDFSQKAVKLLTPKLKQPNLAVSGSGVVPVPVPNKFTFNNVFTTISDNNKTEIDNNNDFLPHNLTKTPHKIFQPKVITPHTPNFYNPMNLLVDGKVVRYVPGIPGPVTAEEPTELDYNHLPPSSSKSKHSTELPPPISTTELPPITKSSIDKSKFEQLEIHTDLTPPPISTTTTTTTIITKNEMKSPIKPPPPSTTLQEPPLKKFARPNSLALKPTTASLKQHHGLTPTMFNQILISPDTPRVAKKYVQQYLHGNYFSYLGLKCSTKPVYCTLNKTQPFYVRHFKKLSMYSEWRQQDTKTDKLYVSAYDSRQKHQRYTTAGRTTADLVVHSSYKFIVSESTNKGEKNDDQQKTTTIQGGYECDDDYTYIRGRGRGRYVCDQCGIRCKKPSMLKKHIKTHSNDRPYTCNHCNFSFKTKGNLTKHMKSKAHTKNYAATGSSSSSTQQSGTQSSDSDTEDSGMDSSDESTRREEHEAAYGLLSLSQKTSQEIVMGSNGEESPRKDTNSPNISVGIPINNTTVNNVMDTEEIVNISKRIYAKNKFLDEKPVFKIINPPPSTSSQLSSESDENFIKNGMTTMIDDDNKNDIIENHTNHSSNKEAENMRKFLGKTTINRPLTYPYTTVLPPQTQQQDSIIQKDTNVAATDIDVDKSETKSIKQFSVIQKYGGLSQSTTITTTTTTTTIHPLSPKLLDKPITVNKHIDNGNNLYHRHLIKEKLKIIHHNDIPVTLNQNNNTTKVLLPVLKVNDAVIDRHSPNLIVENRKRKLIMEPNYSPIIKLQKTNTNTTDEVMDLSMANEQRIIIDERSNGASPLLQPSTSPPNHRLKYHQHPDDYKTSSNDHYYNEYKINKNNGNLLQPPNDSNYIEQPLASPVVPVGISQQPQLPPLLQPAAAILGQDSTDSYDGNEYDNSAMETLADVATKQVKLEKNTLAKSVATEFLKIATKNELTTGGDGLRDNVGFRTSPKDVVNDLAVRPEGIKNCTICSKSFSKPYQLKLHMNIHYLERPFRCDSCSVSFRTKGHLQKHERSASHHNKLSSSPALSSSEPRPFKCVDCNIAFRIHGHLAKHLRSKMHIMKLECLAKIPFGLYAELERSNSLLTEINTADGDQCLESLKTLAKKVFINDPNKLNQLNPTESLDNDDS